MPAAGPARAPRGRRAAVLAVLAVALGVTSGCSSDDDASPPASFTAASSSTTAVAPGAMDRDSYVRAVQAGVGTTMAKGGASDDEVACIAQVWVDVIGVDTFVARGIVAEQVATSSFSYGTLGITDTQADDLLDALGTCGVDLVAFTLDALAPLVDEEQFACITSKVTPDEGRAIGRGLLVGGAEADAGIATISDIAARCGIALE